MRVSYQEASGRGRVRVSYQQASGRGHVRVSYQEASGRGHVRVSYQQALREGVCVGVLPASPRGGGMCGCPTSKPFREAHHRLK